MVPFLTGEELWGTVRGECVCARKQAIQTVLQPQRMQERILDEEPTLCSVEIGVPKSSSFRHPFSFTGGSNFAVSSSRGLPQRISTWAMVYMLVGVL